MAVIQVLILFLIFPAAFYTGVYFKELVNSGFNDFAVAKNLFFSLFVLLICLIFTGIIPLITTGMF
ncbi:MAG: hypothetical protein E6R13_06725 [Spirochaetes bacterium]|jgi:hypothetical protein|nr:MAG: hypothetical protein E6R13_06725 [Spirochaetota bacterium]